MSFKEFKPTIFFLLKFLGLYLAGNILYGLFINAYHPKPDPVTHSISAQTAFVISACGWPVTTFDHNDTPTTSIVFQHKGVLAVYEGCNGVNTIIIFLAFIVAFGPVGKSLVWFGLAGCFIIHLMNLLRITLLFFVSEQLPQFMYFTHKYLFTAFLYGVIFLLWIVWVKYFARKPVREH